MKALIRWIIHHPVSVILIIFIVVLVGSLSLSRLPVEIRPQRQSQQIQITAQWRGQTPETIQRIITVPLENTVSQIKDVNSVQSSTGVGTASIILSFSPKANIKYAYVEVQERIALLQESLPREVVIHIEPYFENEEEEQAQRSSFMTLELSGPYSINQVRRMADERIVPALKGIEGVGRVEVYGGSRLYARVDLDPAKMQKLGLQLVDISRAIHSHIQRKGLGEVIVDEQRFLLLLDNVPEQIHDIANIPLINKAPWRLKDVAVITTDYEKPTSLARHNFNPLVTIDIFKAAGVNALSFSRDIHTLVNQLKLNLPADLQLIIIKDNTNDLRRELRSLGIRATVILSIVFLILFLLFRRLFLSIITLIIIALSILCAAIFLYFIGYTINVVTLAGIALVFGMLVDNAIVVIENIQRHEREDVDIKEAGLKGTLEIFHPMIGATATTLLVFFSLVFLEGRLGDYYRPLAFALGFSLLSSLLLAITLIPALYSRFSKWFDKQTPSRRFNFFTGLNRIYQKFLVWNIRHRKIIYLLFTLSLIITSYLFINRVPRGGFYRWYLPNTLRVYIGAPRGVTLKTLDDIARSFEERIKFTAIPCDVQTKIDVRSATARINITFSDSILYTIAPFMLKEHLISQAVNYAGVAIHVSGFGDAFFNGGYKIYTYYGSRLDVIGPQYNRLQKICESLLDMIKRTPRVSEGVVVPSARNLYYLDLKEITMSTTLKDIWNRGFTYREFANQIGLYLRRQMSQQDISIQNNRIPLQLTVEDRLPQLTELQDLTIQTSRGWKYRIGNFLKTRKAPLPMWIDKENQQYRFTIAWDYRGPSDMAEDYKKSIIENISLPPGYKLSKHDWVFLTKKEEADLLRLLLVVVCGTYIILAALYESFRRPLVIFFSIPFALIGIFLAYLLFDRTFDVNGYLGLILLSGIVVNNAIILVDRIAQLSREGVPLIDAIINGTLQRIRPIFITTFTTIGGLIPLLFLETETSFLSDILEALSFVTISGLLGSTLLTITLIPLVYYSIEKFIYHWQKNIHAR